MRSRYQSRYQPRSQSKYAPSGPATLGQGVGVPAGAVLLRGYASTGSIITLYSRDTSGNSTRLLGRAA